MSPRIVAPVCCCLLVAAGITVQVYGRGYKPAHAAATRAMPERPRENADRPVSSGDRTSARREGPAAAAGARPSLAVLASRETALSSERLARDFAEELYADASPLMGRMSAGELHREMLAEAPDAAWRQGLQDRMLGFVNEIRETFGNAPEIASIACGATLCEVHAVSGTGSHDALAQWQATLARMQDSKAQQFEFSQARTVTVTAADGRVINVTFLVR